MTCSTRVSVRSVLWPVSDTFGTTYGSKRSNCSGVFRSGLPRTNAIAGAPGRTRQASFSSMSTRTCNRVSSPSSISGVLRVPLRANSPSRVLICRTRPDTGARIVRRSISILICSTWADADPSTASLIAASKRRLAISTSLIELPGLKPSATLSRFFVLARLASASLTLATATKSWPCKSRSSILKSGSPVFTRSPHFT